MKLLQPLVLGLLGALLLLPLMNAWANRSGWMDVPTARKAHDVPTPLTGGLTVILASVTAVWLSGATWPSYSTGLMGGLAMCFFIGFWDDRIPLRARFRFMAHFAAAACAIIGGGTVLHALGNTFGPVTVGLWIFGIPFTLVSLTGVINAYNMSDGVDGLCAGHSSVALAAFLACAALIESASPETRALTEIGPIILPVLGALLGFLWFNARHPWRSRAAAFLGDGGSMSLGFLIGWLAVRLTAGVPGGNGISPVTAVWIVSLPMADMFACMIRRINEGVTPMTADRKHLHHMLLATGWSPGQTSALLVGLSAAMATAGIAGWRLGIPEYWMFWGLALTFAIYCRASIRFWARQDGIVSEPQRTLADQSN